MHEARGLGVQRWGRGSGGGGVGGSCVGVDAWEEGGRCEREVAVVGQTKLMLLLRI